jgi:hypothetical protein
MTRIARGIVLFLVLGVVAGVAWPAADSCQVSPVVPPYPMFHDIYVPGGGNDNVACVTPRLYSVFLATFGKRQLWSVTGCDPAIWNVDNGAPSMLQAPRRFTLWTFGTVYPHNPARLSKLTVLDGFPYGFAAYSSEGWVLFKVRWDANGVTGLDVLDHFKFSSLQTNSHWIYGHAMWRAVDGHVYAVGRFLDKATSGFQIVDLGTGASDPRIDSSTIKSILPTQSQSSRFFALSAGVNTYLYQWGEFGVSVYDVTDPANPSYAGLLNHPGLVDPGMIQDYGPALDSGSIVVEKRLPTGGVVNRIYTRNASDNLIHIFDASNPLAPVELASAPGRYDYNVPLTSVASDGYLLALSESDGFYQGILQPGNMVRLFAVGNDSLTEIPNSIVWYDDQGAWRYEIAVSIAVIPSALPGAPYHVARSTVMRGYVDTVESQCVLPAPRRGFIGPPIGR